MLELFAFIANFTYGGAFSVNLRFLIRIAMILKQLEFYNLTNKINIIQFL